MMSKNVGLGLSGASSHSLIDRRKSWGAEKESRVTSGSGLMN